MGGGTFEDCGERVGSSMAAEDQTQREAPCTGKPELYKRGGDCVDSLALSFVLYSARVIAEPWGGCRENVLALQG